MRGQKGTGTRSLKARQLAKARAARQVIKRNQPRKTATKVTKAKVVRAMVDTGGILKTIAKKVGVSRRTLKRYLSLPGWEMVRQVWEDEKEAGIDVAKQTILYAMSQRHDLSTAAATSRWYLSKLEREQFGDDRRTVIEGGDNPIRVATVNVNVDSLDLPIEVKRQILEAIDASEEANRRKQIESREVD